MTETYEASSSGAKSLELHGGFPGDVLIHVFDTDRVRVKLDGVEVDRNWISESGSTIAVRLPKISGGGMTVIQNGGYSSVQINSGGGVIIAGNVSGNVRMSGNRVWIDGVEVTADSRSTNGERASLVIELPSNSRVTSELEDGNVIIVGDGILADIVFTMRNGSLDVSAKTLRAVGNVRNKDVSLRNLRGDAEVESRNGSVLIDCFAAGRVRGESRNGDVVIQDRAGLGRNLDARGRSRNGRVTEPGW